MQDLFDRLAAIPLLVKAGVLGATVVLLMGGYWYFFYSGMLDEKEQLTQEAKKLDKEKKEYEKRKQEYLAFRNEVNALLEEQKELLRVLPKRDDIEQFIENVQAQVELSGLSKVSSVREAATPMEMYMKIPVKMSLIGNYHQINRFFKNVGDLKRIVNIEDLSMVPATDVAGAPPNALKANFIATTFQFLDRTGKAEGSPQKPGSVKVGSQKK
jgi:type IV pilus assembly protein PilO